MFAREAVRAGKNKQAEGYGRVVPRLEAFELLRALSASISRTFGWTLAAYLQPDVVRIRQYSNGDRRYVVDGECAIASGGSTAWELKKSRGARRCSPSGLTKAPWAPQTRYATFFVFCL